ncbi:hypothetical protein [Nitratifractor sp.]
MDLLLKLIESLKEKVYPLYVLLFSVIAGISILVFYGSSYILKEFYQKDLTLNQQLSLLSILFLIFAWVFVTIVETDYFDKLKINELINKHKNASLLFINIVNGILLSLMLINSILNQLYFIILYAFYTVSNIIFLLIFNNFAKKIIMDAIKQKYISNQSENLIKFYYLGSYKKILLFIQFVSVFLSLYLYYEKFSLFVLPVALFIVFNEVIYWGIRIYLYKKINKYELDD